MTTPKIRTHPASNAHFMMQVAFERIGIRPGVREVKGKSVTFDDGRTEEFDVMIGATGYAVSMPFLGEDVSPIAGRRIDVYKRVVHPDCPGLYFVGYFNASGGSNVRMMDVQSEWVAALIAGRVALPSIAAMYVDIARERRTLAKRYPGAPRYELEIDPRQYVKELAAEKARRTS